MEDGDRAIVIFEIQKSNYAPHQTSNTYYMRLDGQSKPAPHHYVEALFKQIRYPEIGGYIKFESLEKRGSRFFLKIKVIIINHSSLQNEEDISFTFTCNNGRFYIPGRTDISRNVNPTLKENSRHMHYENFVSILHYGAIPFFESIIIFESKDLLEHVLKFHFHNLLIRKEIKAICSIASEDSFVFS